MENLTIHGRKIGRPSNGGPNRVDLNVGVKMRQRRTLLGMTQEKLGEALGITFQQVQKYERGANRVGASRLFDLAKALDVPVGYFFEDIDNSYAKAAGFAESPQKPLYGKDPLMKRETLELVKAYYSIKDRKVRARIVDMIRAFGASGQDEAEA